MDRWFRVITFKHSNVGGEALAFRLSEDQPTFSVCTGPTPWGCGSWGPFPVSAITSERAATPEDSFPVSGCPSERWTLQDLRESLASYARYKGWPSDRVAELDKILGDRAA